MVVCQGYWLLVLGMEASVVTLMATCYTASTGLCSNVAAYLFNFVYTVADYC